MSSRFLSCGSSSRLFQRGVAARSVRLAQRSSVRAIATRASTLQAAAKTKPATPATAASSSSGPLTTFALPSHFTQTACGLYVDRSLPPNFTKILIANRGEIACRVIRTCRELGVKTVAVYSDADANSRHVQMADEAYRIGEAPASQSYLLGDRILEIAKLSGAQAIHPGYGFLSENAKFAKKCEEHGVEFIGPPASAIEAMGSKSASKIIMTNAKVPVVPGYHGEDQSPERLQQEAVKCGFPIMLKAVLGGGGKGMRIVHKVEDFQENLEACKREALKSFGDERVLLERYIVRPRHIEFQVFADKKGDAVHLYERDCSVQRRHQKVLEEAPAPGMSEELRRTMGQSAVDAAKAVGYVGAGTVEFIFDAETDEYFFMEMNTRLQVEHPVTEMIMKKDLVQWQLHVAAGNPLPCRQEELKNYGHAIEARVYAENPQNNFLPATGRLVHLSPPDNTPNLRVESGVRQGDEVSIFYDPMISKLCVWGRTRDEALNALSDGLKQYQIVGPPNNIPFLLRSVNHPAFRAGKVETGFIAQNMKDLLPLEPEGHVDQVSASFALLYLLHAEKSKFATAAARTTVPASPWNTPSSGRLNSPGAARKVTLLKENYKNNEGETQDEAFAVEVIQQGDATADTYLFQFGKDTVQVQGRPTGKESLNDLYATVGTRAYHASVVQNGRNLHVFMAGGSQVKYRLPEVTFAVGEVGASGCAAPMSGKIVKVSVEKGAHVKKGQPLVIMEAMKMEHVIRAPKDGVVQAVLFAQGDFVEGGKTVVTFVTEEAKKK
jgi:3-methylcrotonyl-CoA carboxylase alpha subunit